MNTGLETTTYARFETSTKLDDKTHSSFTSPDKSLSYTGQNTGKMKVNSPIPE